MNTMFLRIVIDGLKRNTLRFLSFLYVHLFFKKSDLQGATSGEEIFKFL